MALRAVGESENILFSRLKKKGRTLEPDLLSLPRWLRNRRQRIQLSAALNVGIWLRASSGFSILSTGETYMSDNHQLNFKGQLSTVDFHGHVLQIVDRDGRPYVPLRQICQNLGLDWNGQHQRIKRDQVLSEGVCVIHAPSGGGDQDMICLPLEYLNGWLFGIDENRVIPEIKDALITYKREAYGALYGYFIKGMAVDRKRLETDEQAREAALQELRKLRASDKALYKKVTDAIAFTSVDYQDAKILTSWRVQSLFARIQDTFHQAVSGKTAAQLVIDNADGTKPLVGMKAYDGDPKKITKQAVGTGKNYLGPIAFRTLEILYEQLFLFAEKKIINGDKMTLAKWEDQLQKLLIANGYETWNMYQPGQYLPSIAEQKAAAEHAVYKQRLIGEMPF
jgi:hypothetical protein